MKKTFITLLFSLISLQALAKSTDRCYYLYRDQNLQIMTQELLKISEIPSLFGIFADIELRQANYVMTYSETPVVVYKNFERHNKLNSNENRTYTYHGEFESKEMSIFRNEFFADITLNKLGTVQNTEFGEIKLGNTALFYKEISCFNN